MAETTAVPNTYPDYPRGVTFEEVWAGIKELEKRIKETDRIVRRNGKQMGDLHRRFGQLAEHLVAPNIYKRFNERGYNFGSVVRGNVKIIDEQGNTLTEIDKKVTVTFFKLRVLNIFRVQIGTPYYGQKGNSAVN